MLFRILGTELLAARKDKAKNELALNVVLPKSALRMPEANIGESTDFCSKLPTRTIGVCYCTVDAEIEACFVGKMYFRRNLSIGVLFRTHMGFDVQKASPK